MADIGQAGVIVLLGTILSMLSGFLFRLIGARYLPTDQFGLVVLGISLVNIASIPCILGLNQGVVRFIASEDDRFQNSYITVSIITVLSFSIVAVAIGLIFKDTVNETIFGNSASDVLLFLFLITIPLFSLLKLITGILRGEMNSSGFVHISKIIRPGMKLLLTIVAVFIFGTSTSVALAFFSAILITVFFGLYLIWYEGWRPQVDRSADFLSLYRFSFPLLISSSIFILLSYVDKMLIGAYQSPNSVAIYEVTVTIASLLGLFRSAFGFLLYPKLSEQISSGNESIVGNMYKQTTKWILLLTTPAFVVLVFRPDFLIYIFGSEYSVSEISPVLFLLSSGLFLNAIVGPNGEALLGFGRSRAVLIYNISAVAINIVLNIILIPRFGLFGAAAASLIGYTIMNVLKSFDLYAYHQVSVISSKSILAAATIFIIGAVGIQILPEGIPLPLEVVALSTIGIGSSIIGITILWIIGGVSDEDHELVNRLVAYVS
ncbi:flippase [Haloterrigena salina]|uniref:flippase n=1 Tax=Haloterrigena salina TaxID=504937 RepID=UPI000A774A00|nr:flippase [Haloterrigena salina]